MYIIEYIGSHPPLSNCQNARMVLEDNHQLSVQIPIQGIGTPSLSVGHGVISQRASRWFSTHVKLAATIQSSHGNSLSIMSHEVFDLSPYHLYIYPNLSPKNDRLWHVFTPHPLSLIHVVLGFSSLNHAAIGVSPFQTLGKLCLSLSTPFDRE